MSGWPRSLQLSGAPAGSGSDIAARRLRAALQEAGAQADWISPSQQSRAGEPDRSSSSLFWTHSAGASRLLGRAVDRLDRRRTGLHLSITPGLRSGALRRWPADLIHLHWLGTGFLSLLSLERLGKPLVWTLHDLWPLFGVLPYPSLGNCARLGLGFDFDPLAVAIKQRVLPRGIQFVAPSAWAAKQAECSDVFRALHEPKEIAIIPNAIDSLFLESVLRHELHRDRQHPLLLFGGSNAFTDSRKGWHLIHSLLPWLTTAFPNWRFASFGEIPPKEIGLLPSWHHHGLIHDPHQLAALYRSADLLVMPSKQETFGQVAAEALGCGLPVLAIADTGIGSVVEHLKTGYLIKSYSSKSLQDGLSFCMSKLLWLQAIRTEAKMSAYERFRPLVVAAQHMNLYLELLHEGHKL